jgi:hypothetical protein
MQAALNKFFSLGSTWSGTDEQMVQLYPHAKSVIQSDRRHSSEASPRRETILREWSATLTLGLCQGCPGGGLRPQPDWVSSIDTNHRNPTEPLPRQLKQSSQGTIPSALYAAAVAS